MRVEKGGLPAPRLPPCHAQGLWASWGKVTASQIGQTGLPRVPGTLSWSTASPFWRHRAGLSPRRWSR